MTDTDQLPTEHETAGSPAVPLLACPFCGKTDTLYNEPQPTVECGVDLSPNDPRSIWQVVCIGCGSQGPCSRKLGPEAAHLWNLRQAANDESSDSAEGRP